MIKYLYLIFAMVMFAGCGNSSKSSAADSVQPAGVEASEQVSDASEEVVAGEALPTVIDFYADWCGPCRQMKPVFEKFENEYEGRVKFESVNVDDNQAMAAEYGVEAIPTFVILDASGKEVDRMVGAVPAESLKSSIEKVAVR